MRSLLARGVQVATLCLGATGCFVTNLDAEYIVHEPAVASAAAARLAPKQKIPPLWTVPLGAVAADSIQFVSDSTVVLTTEKLSFNFPVANEFVALDATTGRVLWKRPRGGAVETSTSVVVATTPALWVRSAESGSECTLLKLSVLQGDVEASADVGCGAIAKDDAGRLAAVVGPKSVRAVSLETGAVAWTAQVETRVVGSEDAKGPSLTFHGSRFFVVNGQTLTAINATSGEVVISKDLGARIVQIEATESGGVVAALNGASGGSVTSLTATGLVEWSTPAKGHVAVLATDPDAVAFGTTGPNALVTLERRSGAVRWEQLVAGAPSALAFVDSISQGPPPAARAAEGKPSKPRGPRASGSAGAGRIASPPSPAPVQTPALAVTLGMPPAAQADLGEFVSLADGHVLRSVELPDASPPPFYGRRPMLPDRFVTVDEASWLIRPTAAARIDPEGPRLTDLRKIRGSYLHAADPTTADLPSPVNAGLAEQHAQADLAVSMAFDANNQPVVGGMAGAELGIMSAGAAVHANLAEIKRIGYDERMRFNRASEEAAYHHAIDGDLFVRPIAWTWGEGLSVVELKTGRWAELITSPPRHFFRTAVLGPAPFAVSPKGDLLVSLGIGLDPAGWREYELSNFRILATNVLAFPIDRARLRAPDDYEKESAVGPLEEVYAPVDTDF